MKTTINNKTFEECVEIYMDFLKGSEEITLHLYDTGYMEIYKLENNDLYNCISEEWILCDDNGQNRLINIIETDLDFELDDSEHNYIGRAELITKRNGKIYVLRNGEINTITEVEYEEKMQNK
jgi:hypothetical protein